MRDRITFADDDALHLWYSYTEILNSLSAMVKAVSENLDVPERTLIAISALRRAKLLRAAFNVRKVRISTNT